MPIVGSVIIEGTTKLGIRLVVHVFCGEFAWTRNHLLRQLIGNMHSIPRINTEAILPLDSHAIPAVQGAISIVVYFFGKWNNICHSVFEQHTGSVFHKLRKLLYTNSLFRSPSAGHECIMGSQDHPVGFLDKIPAFHAFREFLPGTAGGFYSLCMTCGMIQCVHGGCNLGNG